ncbi:radical SAM family heme chaperone HemW [Tropicibacter naphthalenivorans]|uniref:Heme chaperone HemW n=1 Tax=Tropicibacter naphthalenivorans TaxID=441103 RepID=A0A0P1GWP7_9RHOB|nr:radical SAM family heme chaperone HemW [Tropicibacter naphthalenivorans]CUH79640.1 Oxygen-independent coproporphyrinogen-III oxidase 1 [Tropicibacter naphthalenivorans]SMC73975.1 oxygen-independent coproporphyrinogen-3 oxidase [Tropicibacter naphthalenivorans]
MTDNWQRGGFGLYVHWPFCEAKCPYCDFNSHVVREIDQVRWARALCAEIRRVAEATPGRVLTSVFFGGGTPSLMLPETVAAVLDTARDCWTWANDIEITLEVNPSSVEAGRFRGIAEAGVNRVSLGVQSLRDDDLRRLGRLHDVAEAKAAIEVAQSVFNRVSFDLIYARQDQALDAWRDELTEALAMGVSHLSLYQLTIEQGTAFGDRMNAGRLRGLPDEDLSADMYEMTQELCDAAGMPAYEVSNHCVPGMESRHNLIYWRYGDWAGVGPGAHGRLSLPQRVANEAWKMPGKWLAEAEAGNADQVSRVLDPQEIAGEYLMMGLRIPEGLDLQLLRSWDPLIAPDAAIDGLIDMGLVWKNETTLGVKPEGRLVLNSIVKELLP